MYVTSQLVTLSIQRTLRSGDGTDHSCCAGADNDDVLLAISVRRFGGHGCLFKFRTRKQRRDAVKKQECFSNNR